MAPEILNQDKASYNEKVDIWATGITLFKLLNGENDEYTAFKSIYTMPQLINFGKDLLRNHEKFEIDNDCFRE